MTTPADLPLADTSDMVSLHRVFREALNAAPRLVGSAPAGNVARVALVASYYVNVLDLLHCHHAGEDELLTPRLLARMPDRAQTIERIAAQHQSVVTAIADAESCLAAWETNPFEEARATALSALVALDGRLTPHLDEEEREILPIAAQCINVAEWGQLPEHGMKSFGGDKLWLIIGLVQEQMTEQQLRQMEEHMPPPLLEFWVGPGRSMFDSYVAALRI